VPARGVVITGGAGYIGSLLTGELLRGGQRVTVLDSLLFGGESLLGYLADPGFAFHKVDVAVADHDLGRSMEGADVVFHLAAIVGFPGCQQVGEQVAWRYNVEATQRVFQAAEAAGVRRFLFASTYSNYGVADEGALVTESSPLRPQSFYARTKIAAEE
jgi:nucleoside-diphosphate-sugar epimerase